MEWSCWKWARVSGWLVISFRRWSFSRSSIIIGIRSEYIWAWVQISTQTMLAPNSYVKN